MCTLIARSGLFRTNHNLRFGSPALYFQSFFFFFFQLIHALGLSRWASLLLRESNVWSPWWPDVNAFNTRFDSQSFNVSSRVIIRCTFFLFILVFFTIQDFCTDFSFFCSRTLTRSCSAVAESDHQTLTYFWLQWMPNGTYAESIFSISSVLYVKPLVVDTLLPLDMIVFKLASCNEFDAGRCTHNVN